MSSSAAVRAAAAKERGKKIKQLQEEALATLPQNTLYIVLYIRNDPPLQDDFHWGYYLHFNKNDGGHKYHIQNLNTGWITDHGKTTGVFKSNFLCVLIRIANVPEAAQKALDQAMRSYDHEVNNIPGVTCRVWIMTILRKLIQQGLVRCADPGLLEQECFSFGNQFSPGAAKNNQPRPVVQSKFCS